MRRGSATKMVFFGAERDTIRLPGRKMPQIRRGRCSDAVPGRKRYHFRCGIGYHPPAGQKNAPKSGAEGAPRRFRAEKGIISGAELDTTRLPGRKMPQIRRRRCSEAVPGRKRYHFRRRTGYHPPAGQENAQNPARNVLRGGSGQKKVSFPARKRIPPACRGRKCLFNPKIFTV